MNYQFTLNGFLFELDTKRKILTSAHEELLAMIKNSIDSCVGHVLWGGHHPLEGVSIKNPYQNIDEFSACLYYGLSNKEIKMDSLEYPTELYDFAPCYAPLYVGMKRCRLFNEKDMEYYEKEFSNNNPAKCY